MKIWIEELEKVNKGFEPASKTKNPGSLEFAAEHAARARDWIKQLAYLIRAILVDHAFEDGNKRTAAYLITYFFDENKAKYDSDKVKSIILKIASQNITSINKIARILHDETL